MKRSDNKYKIGVLVICIFFLSSFLCASLYAAQDKPDKIKPKETAEDHYQKWLLSYDSGKYKESIQYMKKAVEIDQSYSAKIREHIEEKEKEIITRIDVEAKKKEVLAKEEARELKEKKESSEGKPVERRPLKFGPLTMRPSITYRFSWDDNIYLTNVDKTQDYISEFIPGLEARLDLPFGLPFISASGGGVSLGAGEAERTLINLEYRPDIKNFLFNNKESYVGHTAIATTVIPSNLFGGRGKLVFGGRDIFRYTHDRASSEDTKYRPRVSNDMEVKAKYAPNEKLMMAMAYRYQIEWYTQDSMRDFNYYEHTFTPTIYYNITPKTSIFVDTDLAKIIYIFGNRDSVYAQVSGGITGQVTPKTNVYFKMGGQIRHYTHKELYKDHYVSLTTRGSISSRLRKDVFMKISFIKEPVESTYQDNPYFNTNEFDFELVKHLTGKASIITGASFGRNDYPRNSTEDAGKRTRRDYIWGFRGGLSYKLLKGLDSAITYELRGRDSNFNKYNYRDNRIFGNIRVAY